MSFGTLIVLVFIGIRLFHDYQRDGWQHRKAKALHALSLLAVGFSYASTFPYLANFFRYFDRRVAEYSVGVGFLPGPAHLTIYLAHLLLSLAIIFTAFRLATRSKKARSHFLTLLPFLALTEILSFYRGWLTEGDDPTLNHTLILFMGLLLFGGMTMVIVRLYSSQTMKAFFDSPREAETMPEAQPAPGSTDLADQEISTASGLPNYEPKAL